MTLSKVIRTQRGGSCIAKWLLDNEYGLNWRLLHHKVAPDHKRGLNWPNKIQNHLQYITFRSLPGDELNCCCGSVAKGQVLAPVEMLRRKVFGLFKNYQNYYSWIAHQMDCGTALERPHN